MKNLRIKRLSSDIQRYVSDIIRNELKDPRLEGLLSITGCDVTSDLSYAKLYFSYLGSKDKDEIMTVLKEKNSFIRKNLAGKLSVRHVPELILQWDTSIEYGEKIDNLLHEIGEKKDE